MEFCFTLLAQKSSSEILASVFWDRDGILLYATGTEVVKRDIGICLLGQRWNCVVRYWDKGTTTTLHLLTN
jgi:hypothetical protein